MCWYSFHFISLDCEKLPSEEICNNSEGCNWCTTETNSCSYCHLENDDYCDPEKCNPCSSLNQESCNDQENNGCEWCDYASYCSNDNCKIIANSVLNTCKQIESLTVPLL